MRRTLLPLAAAAAVLAVAPAQAAPAVRTTFDLGRGTVNGRVLLGASPQTLLKALGKPRLLDGVQIGEMSKAAVQKILTTPSKNPHVVVWGPGTHWRVAAQVGKFGTRKQPIVWSLIFANPADREKRTGLLLQQPPELMELNLRQKYADLFKPGRAYACGAATGTCYGTLSSKDGRRGITFGLLGQTSVRYVNLWLVEPKK